MSAANTKQIQELRRRTGAGMLHCKSTLEATKGDLDQAVERLRLEGVTKAETRSTRRTGEGVIASYIHHNGRLAALVEVNCETDFVARTDDFQQLVKDVAMQVAAANPLYVAREHVPGNLVEKEREIYREQMADQKKPAQVLDKIIEGKLEKFYTETCLLEQPFIKDSSGKTKMKDLVDQATAKLGERVLVKRFARFQVGEA